jgi:hypothetical protein
MTGASRNEKGCNWGLLLARPTKFDAAFVTLLSPSRTLENDCDDSVGTHGALPRLRGRGEQGN